MKILFTFFMLVSALHLSAQQSIVGSWNMGSDNENTVVEITETGGVCQGTIASSDNAKAKIGNTILKEIKADGDAWKGKMFSPKKGKWYNAVFEEKGGNLMVTVKAGMMSKTMEWKKA